MNFEEYLRLNDIYIYPVTLPTKIRGLAYYNGFSYTVYINNKLGYEQQKNSTIHELIHIFENHFECPNYCRDECEERTKMIVNNLRNANTAFDYIYWMHHTIKRYRRILWRRK